MTMEQTPNQRIYAVVSKKGHDIKIVLRAMELALCNAILDETSKFVVIGDISHGTLRSVVQEVAKRNKIEAPDDIFGFYKEGGDNAEFSKRKILVFNPSGCNTVPKQVNAFLKANAEFLHRRFVHVFMDDTIITNAWNPLMVEMMMHDLRYPFYCDPKTSQTNHVFGKLSPVKTFVYNKKVGERNVLPYPVVFYGVEDDRYFVFDTECPSLEGKGAVPFDEKLRTKFVVTYIHALMKKGLVPAYDYLPDPFLNVTLTKNPLFKTLTDDEKKELVKDLQNDRPIIDELNKERRENDFERWDGVQKLVTDTCDRIEKELTEEAAKTEVKDGK